jgi:hypothetical protein
MCIFKEAFKVILGMHGKSIIKMVIATGYSQEGNSNLIFLIDKRGRKAVSLNKLQFEFLNSFSVAVVVIWI